MKIRNVSSLFLILLLSVTSGWADVIRVPEDQETIQAGINAASTGDTVLVSDGTFSGVGNSNIDFHGKDLVLKSENGLGSTTIDARGTTRVFYFHTYETGLSKVEGFILSNGNADDYGGGVLCYVSSPSIIDCKIINSSSGNSGGGICLFHSSAVISGCTIENNHATNKGGGIYIYEGSEAVVNCSEINSNMSLSGGGISLYQANATIINCILTHNSVSSMGGGIECVYSENTNVTHCTISSNEALSNCGGLRSVSSDITVSNCILWGDDNSEICGLGNLVVNYSDIEGGWVGDGNIDQDPMFIGSGDFHLTEESPCIDTGTNAGVTTDIEDDPRPQGAGFDMGADELIPENMILTAMAHDGLIEEKGIDSDDYVIIDFAEQTSKPEITAENIDELLQLNNGHTWLDWSGGLGTADWNITGDQLYILLSTHIMGPPTVAPGDIVTPFISLVRSEGISISGTFDPESSVNDTKAPNTGTALLSCFPNPFNPVTNINFTLNSDEMVRISIFDISGNMIDTPVESVLEAGQHSYRWDGRNSSGVLVGSGVYICRMEAGNVKDTIKMVLLK